MNALVSLSLRGNNNLEDQITQLAANINAANFTLLQLVAEFDQQRRWAK